MKARRGAPITASRWKCCRTEGLGIEPNRVFVPLSLPRAAICAASAQVLHLNGLTMGTTWSLKLIPPSHGTAQAIRDEAQHILDRVVAQMSTWEADSDLSRFNAASAGTWHAFPDDCFEVVACALRIAEESGGAYDPTIGPLVNLWGFGPHARRDRPPMRAEIDTQRSRCGWQRLELDHSTRSVLQPGGAYVDLSAIAKGFAVDKVADYLKRAGCAAYLVEVGGELSGFGMKPDGSPWWVELESPASPGAESLNLIALHGLSVATSGDYRRYFEAGGRRYCHTIDPRTGVPIEHGLASVSVLNEQCVLADAWSTALNVMGAADGMAFATERSIAALFMERTDDGLVERLSPALAAMLD